MIRFAVDENLAGALVRALRRRIPEVDLVRVQDVGLMGAEDPAVLSWAASEGRVLLTRDVNTIPHFAYERIRGGVPMTGVIIVPQSLSIALAVADLELVAECMTVDECRHAVVYLPLR